MDFYKNLKQLKQQKEIVSRHRANKEAVYKDPEIDYVYKNYSLLLENMIKLQEGE